VNGQCAEAKAQFEAAAKESRTTPRALGRDGDLNTGACRPPCRVREYLKYAHRATPTGETF
jgi:hypothetical protein